MTREHMAQEQHTEQELQAAQYELHLAQSCIQRYERDVVRLPSLRAPCSN